MTEELDPSPEKQKGYKTQGKMSTSSLNQETKTASNGKMNDDNFKQVSVNGLSSIYETNSYSDSKLLDQIQSLQQ